MKMFLAVAALTALFAFPAVAADLATAAVTASPTAITRGGHGKLVVTISMAPNAHVQAHLVPDPSFIPTNFKPDSGGGIKLGAPKYPVGTSTSSGGIKQSIYEGQARITVPITVATSATPGTKSVGGKLTFQACNETVCFPPKTVTLTTIVTVK
jgi:DsbC/DsbD-like thiol-disulfide interchange protein